jgi:hypothetical protein
MLALEEVHPAFGVSEEELEGLVQNGIIHYDETVEVSNQSAKGFRLNSDTVHSSTCSSIGGASPDINENTARICPLAWPRGDRQICSRGYHCEGFRVSVH